MILTGDKVNVLENADKIKDFLMISSNLEHLLPMDKIRDFISDETSCSFKVQGGFMISLIQDGSDGNKVFLKSGEKSPFPFKLIVFLEEISENETKGHIEFDGEVNAFLKLMVEKPLLSLFNYMSSKLSKHYS
ncbi:MAG: hypothetical protein QNK70_04350 [Crocinitomicaceae bacterium]|tara:strand:+ start:1394 stop:1792 length:399 start_codon:yes stop_codon:yes gene_type:complete